jgi:catechol 2,3-dioxygenase-like lactoylglutathione lyase family enzyme
MTLPTETAQDADLRRCGCCGRVFPEGHVAELGSTPGVFICAGCALWAARRAGVLSALRQVRLRSLLPRLSRRAPHTARTAIPILPSSDLDRSAAFYVAAGFSEFERHDGYLLLHNSGVELHFSLDDVVTAGTCFVHVADATKLWKQLRHLDVDDVGELADQEYGLREFTLTDPDGNQVRFGSPRP